jgi:hypothetical protein
MSKNYFLTSLFLSTILVSCGGGGGGGGGGESNGSSGGGYGTPTNAAPTINNTDMNISVQENQTSAFTVNASDSNGDTLAYSLSGDDSSLLSISTAGLVTFNTAPDYEDPSDADTNNIYKITASVSDGSLNATKNFEVTVTNDTADDVTTSNFDGVLIRDGYIQSATVCMPVTDADGDDTCEGATYLTTTNADGSFSLDIDDNITATIKLLAEDGFNPITNDEDSFTMGLIDPSAEQNLVISPLSTMLYVDDRFSYESIKEKLGVDSNFMIRTVDPYMSVSSAASNKAALVNTQLLMMYETLSVLQTQSGASNLTAVTTVNNAIFERDAATETSLGDTTLVRDVLLNLNLPNYTVTNEQLENLSGSFSSFLQKVYVDSNNEQAYFSMTARDHVAPLLKGILDDTADSSEIDQIIFNTLQWISDKSSRTNLTDVEDFRTTSYTIGNSGSAYYTVDGVNADSTALIIYARVGDTIVFEPTTNSVFTAHPFEISTAQNDTAGNNNIGSSEGWSQSNNTLTVTADTPTILYPHCGVHSGMYTNGKIEIVTTFDQSKIDINQASSALEVNGTVSVGPYKGASGFTHKVYLRTADAGDSQHAHEFNEYPGITFYMPPAQGYHGQSTSSGEPRFKTKSHY